MKIRFKFLIIFVIAFSIAILPNLLLFNKEVFGWVPVSLWIYLSIAWFILLVGMFIAITHNWIIKPLNDIARALSSGDAGHVAGISRRRDEIGDIARLLAIRHITIRKEAEMEVSRMLSKQRELDLLKSRFISLVSHEIRTPLSAISSNVQLLSRYQDKWPAEKKSVVIRRIQKAIHIMITLLEEVTLISKDQSGSLSVNPETIPIHGFITDLIDEIRKHDEIPIHLTLAIDPGDDLITSDKELLRQIFLHLLSNAGKFQQEEKPIRVSISRKEDHIAIQVTDQGIGIPEEDMEELFQPFHRGSNSDDMPGSGLGLSIVKRCIELLDGSIRVKSKLNSGTAIDVTIPAYTTKTTIYE